MKYAWIQVHRGNFPVKACCRVLGVSTAGYYRQRKAGVSEAALKQRELDAAVAKSHADSNRVYGCRKVAADLNLGGGPVKACLNTVAKSTKRQGLVSKVKHRFKPGTTHSNPLHPKAANVLDRGFNAEAPNDKWVTDITYIDTAEGWAYLATVTDLFARKIVGWAIADHMRTPLVVEALRDAVEQRRPGHDREDAADEPFAVGLLLHSDRGSRYTSNEFCSILRTLNIQQSMSGKAECWDNAVAETVFGKLKGEWTEHEQYADLAEARLSIRRYVRWFNHKRRHQGLGYLTPEEAERAFYKASNESASTPAATVAAGG